MDHKIIPYTSRDVIFEVFVVNWPSVKFYSQIFIGKTLACINRRAEYLVIPKNKILDL